MKELRSLSQTHIAEGFLHIGIPRGSGCPLQQWCSWRTGSRSFRWGIILSAWTWEVTLGGGWSARIFESLVFRGNFLGSICWGLFIFILLGINVNPGICRHAGADWTLPRLWTVFHMSGNKLINLLLCWPFLIGNLRFSWMWLWPHSLYSFGSAGCTLTWCPKGHCAFWGQLRAEAEGVETTELGAWSRLLRCPPCVPASPNFKWQWCQWLTHRGVVKRDDPRTGECGMVPDADLFTISNLPQACLCLKADKNTYLCISFL